MDFSIAEIRRFDCCGWPVAWSRYKWLSLRPLVSLANPTATHGVRSGVDECFVTNGRGARAGLVLGRFRWQTRMAHYKLAVAARFLCLLSLARQRK